jgi:hypothetical protein
LDGTTPPVSRDGYAMWSSGTITGTFAAGTGNLNTLTAGSLTVYIVTRRFNS